MNKISVAITGPNLSPDAQRSLAEHASEVRQLPGDLEIGQLIKRLDGIDFYVLGGNESLGPEFFEDVPRSLKGICFVGTGYSTFIDVPAAYDAGISLSYTPHANARSTAEFAFLLAMAGIRGLLPLAENAKRGNWKLAEQRSFYRAQIGIVGFGHVSRSFLHLARGASSKPVWVWNRSDKSEEIVQLGGVPCELDELFASCDLISLHADWPGNASGHLIGQPTLGVAKSNLVLVNAGRARLVSPTALREFLSTNPHACALFDGYYEEPSGADSDSHGLIAMDNFVITPHAAYLTDDSNDAMAAMVVENIEATAAGLPVPYPIPLPKA